MLVDTHAHLDLPEFAGDLSAVLERAAAAGVERILTVGIDLDSSRAAVELADRHPGVWAAVGVHPNDTAEWNGAEIDALRELAAHPKVAAVGETGLDFHRQRAPRDRQEAAFRGHLALAREFRLPVIIHAREALADCLALLRGEPSLPPGVMHCFAGSADDARPFLELGLHLSLGGPVTYPNAGLTRTLVEALPLERILLETDCPFLPPQGHRGERNEPSYLPAVAGRMAQVKNLTPEDVARITTRAARGLFGLDIPLPGAVFAYRIRRSVYLNLTNRCQNACVFCHRQTDPRVKGHDLGLDHEPDLAELLAATDRETDFDEVVFCGYGEPLLRADLVESAARVLKKRGLRVRVNTNGLAPAGGDHRSLPARLEGLVDSWSVSLNAADAATYSSICRPPGGDEAFGQVLTFIREALAHAPEVTATAVSLPGVDLRATEALAASLGARFRVRPLNEVG